MDIFNSTEKSQTALFYNLVLLPNIATANCNTLTNKTDYFDFIKRRGFIYEQVTSLNINNLVRATN